MKWEMCFSQFPARIFEPQKKEKEQLDCTDSSNPIQLGYMNTPLLIQTTLETEQDAEKLAKILLSKKIVACAQISGPLKSLYWWNGEIEESPEYRLILKSFTGLYPQIEKLIHEKHPYNVPEIVATKISQVGESYLSWMKQEIDYGS